MYTVLLENEARYAPFGENASAVMSPVMDEFEYIPVSAHVSREIETISVDR